MKIIVPYVLAILVLCGAVYFALDHKKRFEDLQADRIETIATNKKTSADADVTEKQLKDERAVLATATENRDMLKASIEALKSSAAGLERDITQVNSTLEGQKAEFVELDKTMKEVAAVLADLGNDINLDNLPEKIEQVQEDKKGKGIKLEELTTLVATAEKTLAASHAELDRLMKRDMDRSARIRRNSMEAVITAVNQDWGFLVIGAGTNSGFTPQTSLIVQRDGRLIGRVHPSSIEPTQTIAEIEFKSLAAGVRLQPGDHVILAAPVTN